MNYLSSRKNRILLGVLAAAVLLVLMVTLLPTTANAATEGGFTYSVSGGKVTITDYTGSGGAVTIPSTLGGYPVTAIGEDAFYNCSSLTTVTIPDSVTTIGNYAFYNCTGLETVTITDPNAWCKIQFGDDYSNPMGYADRLIILDKKGKEVTDLVLDSTVTTIPNYAFHNCSSLTSVTIPDSVTSIGSGAFWGCTSLTTLNIPDSVTSIGSGAFYSCTGLTSVTIPDSVTTIGSSAFEDCTRLTSVTIPDSVTTIGYFAFYNCTGLKDVYYAGTQEEWKAISIGSNNSNLTNATIHYSHIHDYSLITPVTVAATCTEAGYIEYTCVYGETCREILPALGHDFSGNETVTAPTCTQQGYTTVQCTRCEETTKQDFTSAIGHSMAAVPAVAPTCTEPGLTVGSSCQNCGLVGIAQKPVAALGHNYSQGTCLTCGDRLEYTVTFLDEDGTELSKATYHYGDKVTAPAEPTKAADNTYTYAFAGWDQEVADCAGDATYTATYKATYIEYTVKFVYEDGTLISEKAYHYGDTVEVPADPEKAPTAEGEYTFTGWDKEITAVTGDVTYTAQFAFQQTLPDFTGDGQVTDADAIYLLRNTLFPESYPLSGNGDINCDGQITDADAIYLLRHTLFPESYPLYPNKE